MEITKDNGYTSSSEEVEKPHMSTKESLDSERDQDNELDESEIHSRYVSSSSSNELSDIDEKIYFRSKLISSLEEINKLIATN